MRLLIGNLLTLSAVVFLGCQDSDSPPREQQEMSQNEPGQSQAANGANGDETKVGNGKQTVTAKKVIQETKEALDAAGHLAADTKDEYVAKLSAQLEEYDEEIAAVKAKGQELQGEAKEEWKQRLDDLKEKREALGEKLEKLKASSGDAWKDLRKGTTKAWGNLRDSFDAAAKSFSSDSSEGEASGEK